MNYRDFITSTLQKASQIANDNFGNVTSIEKGNDNNQVLTETDLAIGRLLVSEVQKNFPKHNVIDEESGVIDNTSDYTWVIDPIDGTSNFANGVPMYGIYLGLLKNDMPIVGGMSIPSLEEIYVAEKGKGAYCNNKLIHVTKEKKLQKVLVAYGIDAHPEEKNFVETEGALLMNIVLKIRNLRTSNSAYDGAMVAKGAYGAWFCRSSKIWDNVALQVIIEEAGGLYTDFYGNRIDYSNALEKTNENFTYCAASPILHKQLQEIINKVS